ncbi:guanine deaminase [Penicillium riverlandense]|uniref:guanine deaminase n=1 Tax=Penicillium riverlandense TaxID=1903569 RepID=UPI0025482567|nr:guanine deaminase [Penicillium riverlandense]KAJ5819363.1 guanine deaminase [Penicillium riverlandense]
MYLPTLFAFAFASVTSAVATIANPTLIINGVSFATRAHWMRLANEALSLIGGSACPFAAFGSVIVNHTQHPDGLGELVCMGANSASQTGNPSLQGEMAAIKNCTAVLTDPRGRFQMSPTEAQAAFTDLSLYTNAESCPMCASAIRWSGFREYIYGTSIDTLITKGWGQIRVASVDIFEASFDLPDQARLIGNVLTNETDPLFFWQYDPTYPCPNIRTQPRQRSDGVATDLINIRPPQADEASKGVRDNALHNSAESGPRRSQPIGCSDPGIRDGKKTSALVSLGKGESRAEHVDWATWHIHVGIGMNKYEMECKRAGRRLRSNK